MERTARKETAPVASKNSSVYIKHMTEYFLLVFKYLSFVSDESRSEVNGKADEVQLNEMERHLQRVVAHSSTQLSDS